MDLQGWIELHQNTLQFVEFSFIFGAVWFVVCAVVSYVGGWATLASRYRCQSDFVGERWPFQNGWMRWTVHYGNCLTVGGNSEGLYLAVFTPFRFGHPPLLIPWGEITITRRQFLFIRWVRFEIGRELHIPLSIRTTLARRLHAVADGKWPVEREGVGFQD